MITNLVENAFSYGGTGVEIQTQHDQKNITLSVLDRGPGIPNPDIPRVIQPFARLDESRSGRPGAGLGLAIVQRIVKTHGGTLTLKNREGGGLQALVTLPFPEPSD